MLHGPVICTISRSTMNVAALSLRLPCRGSNCKSRLQRKLCVCRPGTAKAIPVLGDSLRLAAGTKIRPTPYVSRVSQTCSGNALLLDDAIRIERSCGARAVQAIYPHQSRLPERQTRVPPKALSAHRHSPNRRQGLYDLHLPVLGLP